MHVPLPLAWRR